MKKITALVTALLAALLVGTGCAQKPTYADGVYFAVGDMNAKNGYRTMVTAKVEKGYLSQVDWNELNISGTDKKSLGDAYGMKAVSPIGKEWYEQAEAVERALLVRGPRSIKYTESGSVTSVSGASIGVTGVLTTYDRAMTSAAVPQGPLADGIYTSRGEAVDGYEDVLTAVVVNGTVVYVYWDRLPVDPAEGQAPSLRLAQPEGSFSAEAAAYEQAVLAAQGPAGNAAADALLSAALPR